MKHFENFSNMEEYREYIKGLSKEELVELDLYLKKLAKSKDKLVGYPSLDKPWLKYYTDENIRLEMPKMNAYEFIKSQNKNNMDNVAINYIIADITYRELFAKIDETADSLVSLGIKEGDTVASTLPNVPEAIYLIYACAKIGAIVDTFDPLLSSGLIKKYCDKSNAKVLFTLDVMAEEPINCLRDVSYDKVITVSPLQSVPVLNNPNEQVPINYNENIISWGSFIENKHKTSKLCEYKQNRPFAFLHTGGTSGVPKGAIISHDNLISLACQVANSPLDLQVGETVLNLMPPFVSYGLCNGTHVNLACGLKLILIPTYDPSKIEEQIMQYKPNRLACSPAHFEHIKNSTVLQHTDLSFLRHPMVGGDTLNVKTELALNKMFLENGCQDKIVKAYGLTESAAGVIYCVNNEVNKLKSVGIPLVKNNIGIFDWDDPNCELPYNVPGELALDSPNNMLGYLNMPEETEMMLKKHSDGHIWLHTGDIAYIDEDGNVFITGRKRRLIPQFGGMKSNPFEAEAQIMKHTSVKNAVVVGVPDPDHEQGKLPVAYVLVDEKDLGNEDLIKEDLINICNQFVTYYSIPVDYVFVTELPTTTRGKIDFMALENSYKTIAATRKLIPQRKLEV